MTIQQALQKAKENGYIEGPTNGEGVDSWPEVALIDPLFWQSLGKAMGWSPMYGEWKTKWHRFIDHLAEGKDINSFFENLK